MKSTEAQLEAARVYREKNREELNRRQREYNNNNKEKRSAIRKKSYIKNRDKALEYTRSDRNKYNRMVGDLRRKYRFTEEEYRSMMDDQKGCCLACGDSLDKPHIDHDHKTGKVRAILCRGCNIAYGQLKERRYKIKGLLKLHDTYNK